MHASTFSPADAVAVLDLRPGVVFACLHRLDIRDRLEFERYMVCLHALGPRVVGEALAEIIDQTADFHAALRILRRYMNLSEQQLRAAGGDRFPPRPLNVVPFQKRDAESGGTS